MMRNATYTKHNSCMASVAKQKRNIIIFLREWTEEFQKKKKNGNRQSHKQMTTRRHAHKSLRSSKISIATQMPSLQKII